MENNFDNTPEETGQTSSQPQYTDGGADVEQTSSEPVYTDPNADVKQHLGFLCGIPAEYSDSERTEWLSVSEQQLPVSEYTEQSEYQLSVSGQPEWFFAVSG